ncbi:MAG: hypothetical protein PHT76_10075, partial [Anaerostipes sp.]|nr:hypothetical protein [Anaerostipes sp.]
CAQNNMFFREAFMLLRRKILFCIGGSAATEKASLSKFSHCTFCCSVLSVFVTAIIDYHSHLFLSITFFNFFLKSFCENKADILFYFAAVLSATLIILSF